MKAKVLTKYGHQIISAFSIIYWLSNPVHPLSMSRPCAAFLPSENRVILLYYQSYPEIVGILTSQSDDFENSGIVGTTTPQFGEHAMIIKGRPCLL